MDVFGLLGYINKFSLLAFIATLGVLVYQVYQLKKDSKSTHETPVIPDFNDNAAVPSINFSPLNTKVETEPVKSHNMNLIILIVITVGIVLFIFFSIFMKGNKKTEVDNKEEPLIKLAASKGIKVYDSSWSELNEAKIAALKGGDEVIVGIERTTDPGIDKARIRLNKAAWDTSDEDLTFDKTTNIFYKKFAIATDSAFLKIEAQLHHTKDGWLGE
jgi:hypothetical protein